MHVVADVPLVGDERLSRVEADAHVDRAEGQRLGENSRRRESSRRGRKREEEGIALRVDLHSALRPACLPDDAAVLGQCVGIRFGAE
jgi:hypothetical protein